MLCVFHFINRMADLLNVDADIVPEGFRVLGPVRKLTVRITCAFFARTFDLSNRVYEKSVDDVIAEFDTHRLRGTETVVANDLSTVRGRPQILEALWLSREEREQHSTLAKDLIEQIYRVVEQALPEKGEDTTGLHKRPADPVEAFTFVGTRYARRTTPAMVSALREAGYDDLGILDLAIAIADANSWVRLRRLLDLDRSVL